MIQSKIYIGQLVSKRFTFYFHDCQTTKLTQWWGNVENSIKITFLNICINFHNKLGISFRYLFFNSELCPHFAKKFNWWHVLQGIFRFPSLDIKLMVWMSTIGWCFELANVLTLTSPTSQKVNYIFTVTIYSLSYFVNFSGVNASEMFGCFHLWASMAQSCRKWSDIPEADSVVFYRSYLFIKVISNLPSISMHL